MPHNHLNLLKDSVNICSAIIHDKTQNSIASLIYKYLSYNALYIDITFDWIEARAKDYFSELLALPEKMQMVELGVNNGFLGFSFSSNCRSREAFHNFGIHYKVYFSVNHDLFSNSIDFLRALPALQYSLNSFCEDDDISIKIPWMYDLTLSHADSLIIYHKNQENRYLIYESALKSLSGVDLRKRSIRSVFGYDLYNGDAFSHTRLVSSYVASKLIERKREFVLNAFSPDLDIHFYNYFIRFVREGSLMSPENMISSLFDYAKVS